MGRRKKLPQTPDYTGMAPNQTVQKSDPLQSLSDVLSLPELKILDVYLSRINSHEPEKRFVRFEKGELENLLGVARLNRQDLDERLKRLFKSVTVKDEDEPRGYVRIGLFEKAAAIQDDDGLWQVDLICTESAMYYIFNIENLHYLQYKLRNVVNLTSIYSYRMFTYLEKNRFRKSWEVKVQDLKDILSANAETYKEYKRFNDLVLKKCHRELMEKTECHYDYETIKKGRNVVAIRFTLETKSDLEDEQIEGQITLEEYLDQVEQREDRVVEYWESAVEEYHFNDDEIAALRARLASIPRDKLPTVDEESSDDVRWYHLMWQLVTKMKSMGKVSSPYKYLLRMLENEGMERKASSKPKKTNSFNNIDQREIDFDEEERKAFGF